MVGARIAVLIRRAIRRRRKREWTELSAEERFERLRDRL
jgi:hypothetical protein